MDIAPAFLELAGVRHPGSDDRGRAIEGLRGRSLLGWFQGTAQQVRPAGTNTGWELFGRRAIRKDDLKAVYVPGDDGVSRWQLYELSRDRGEIHDLADSQPQHLLEFLQLWERYRAETGVGRTALSIFDADPAAWQTDRWVAT